MTKNQIAYLLGEVLGYSANIVTPLSSVSVITLNKEYSLFPKIESSRYKFVIGESDDDSWLEVYRCRPFEGTEIPSGLTKYVHYDTIGGQIYKYLVDKNNIPIIDYYSFSSIASFSLKNIENDI